MLSAITVLTDDLSAQAIYRLLKQSKPEAQYKLRCIIETNEVRSPSSMSKFFKVIMSHDNKLYFCRPKDNPCLRGEPVLMELESLGEQT